MTVIRLMTVLKAVFGGESWNTWRAILKAAFAIDLTDDERQIVEKLTGRTVLPSSPVRELWLLLGRRSGKEHRRRAPGCLGDHLSQLHPGARRSRRLHGDGQ
jgi:hypothetical protein